MAGSPRTARGNQRRSIDLSLDDDSGLCGARVRAASRTLLDGDDGFDWDGVRICRDSRADAVVHGSVALEGSAARSTALVAPSGYALGHRPPWWEPGISLFHFAS